MRRTEYTCDRCGAKADRAASVYWYELPLTQAHDLTVRDLCPACAEELRGWLESKKEDSDGR